MALIYIVDGEHPFDPYFPQEAFASPESADRRAEELTREFLAAFWDICHDEDGPPPDVTLENWPQIVEEHGNDEEHVQDDRWGHWFVTLVELEVLP